jgi:hypothetical protein
MPLNNNPNNVSKIKGNRRARAVKKAEGQAERFKKPF